MSEVAIIGAGAAAAAVVCALREQQPETMIHWIAPVPERCRGVAYAEACGYGLLNVRAAAMRLRSSQPRGFLDYLQARYPDISATDFVPRSWFGDYIETEIAAHRGTEGLSVYSERATGIEALPQAGYRIRMGGQHSIEVKQVVLALGSLAPTALAGVSPSTLAAGRYWLDPHRLPELASSPGTVVVIGTGLTAMDTLVDAAQRWPQAQLLAVSPHGQLPSSHPAEPGPPFQDQAELNAALLADPHPRAIVARLRRAIAAAPQQWRAIIDGMRPINSQLWQAWSHAQQAQFGRHLRSLWDRCRHRMPPATSVQIQTLLDSGRLSILPARLLSAAGTDTVQLQLAPRGQHPPLQISADLVIQATGLNNRVESAADPLLQDLLQHGLAHPAAHGLGVASLPNGQLLNQQQHPVPGLFAIGTLLRGTLWECTAMPEISAAAEALARQAYVSPH